MAKQKQDNPFAGLLTERHFQETEKCLGNCTFTDQLLDKYSQTGADVSTARDILQRQRDRLQAFHEWMASQRGE